MIGVEQFLKAATKSAHRPLRKDISPSVKEKIEQILEGTHTVEDAIEMQLDEGVGETTTAAAVGSGLEKPVGNEKKKHEKLVKAYGAYCESKGLSSSLSSVKEFFSETMLPLEYEQSRKLFNEFVEHLKAEGVLE